MCECPTRFTGDLCEIDKCSLIKCQNGGYCTIKDGNAICMCQDKYVGVNCEKECKCENGKCKEASGKINCICNPEFGKYEEGVCKACECGKGANCTFKPGSWPWSDPTKTCICPKGFTIVDNVCVDPDTHNPCLSNPCKNGAICEKNGVQPKCNCLPGFKGSFCEKDVCKPNPCRNDGTCNRNTGKAVCTCKDAYIGDKCQTAKCSLIDCRNGGQCEIRNKNAVCICKDKYIGDNCETEKCSLINCQNGGQCEVKDTNAVCICSDRYSGEFCEIDKCLSITCQNGGKCDIENGKAICICEGRFGGEFCELEASTPSPSPPSTTRRGTTHSGTTTKKTTEASTPTTTRRRTPHATTTTKKTTKASTPTPSPPTSTRRKTTLSTTTTKQTTVSSPEPFSGTQTTTKTTPQRRTETIYTGTSIKIDSTTEIVPDNDTLTTTDSFENITSNYTGSTIELVTDNDTVITTDSFGNMTSHSTGYRTDIGTQSLEITTSTISEQETTATTPSESKVCKKNPCRNGGTCIKENDEEICLCRHPYVGKTCEADYWCSGPGQELCSKNNCTFDFNTRIGHCVCSSGQYYDYYKKECKDIDKCPLTPDKCTRANEICKDNKCQCKDNYKKNDKNECVPAFCEKMGKERCKSNTICKENLKDPQNVICDCELGYVFNGRECIEVDKCNVPGILGCQQICNSTTESCSCFEGYELQEDKKSCKLGNESYKCSKDCKPGICYLEEGQEICICPATHVLIDETCKDLCSAGNLSIGMCPGDSCEPHPDLGFRCKCNGVWTYDVNNVTCRRKLMCSEGGGIKVCADKSAKCVEDDKLGFKCMCSETEDMDEDGICKNKCELKKWQDYCRGKLAECDMQGSKVTCKCPTLLTFNKRGVCTELAASFSGEIPFDKSKYTSKILFAPGGKAPAPDYDKMKQDLQNAMQLIYGNNYRSADIKNCEDTKYSLLCSVEIKFATDPKDQVKLVGDSETCIPGESNNCLIPPELILVKRGLNTNLLIQTDPCAESIKQINCAGNETICRSTTADKRNFECACREGFESYSAIYPVSDRKTVIHNCRDVDECLLPRACPNRTRCLNTYGSYECLCDEGYKPVNVSSSPKKSECVAVCGPDTCGNGVCKVEGSFYTCRCNDGYAGSDCKQKLEKNDIMKPKAAQIALIALSTIVVPLALFSAYMVHKYRILSKKAQKTNYLDDNSSTLSMEPLRPALRP